MKKYIIAAGALALMVSCTKESPIQRECGNAKWITEYYNLEKVHQYDVITDSTTSVVCGQQFQNYKIEEAKNFLVPFTSYCPQGVTLYYMRFIIKTSH